MSVKISTKVKNVLFDAIKTAFADGVILIYTGSQPANANAAVSGTLLGKVTKSAGSWTAGGVYATADDDGVCTSQSPGAAGNLTINGVLASAGTATLSFGSHVTITSGGNDTTAYFTVTGTQDGVSQSETVIGSNASVVSTTKWFDTVTQVYISKASAGTVKVGIGITNGLLFDNAEAGTLAKPAAATWQVTWTAAGTAGWFRLVGNVSDAGAGDTSTYLRLDGRVALTGAELNLSNLDAVIGATATVDSFAITWPSTF